MKENYLTLAPHKTEAMILKDPRKRPTQFLLEHGSFRVYTKRIGRTEDDVYSVECDTVLHAVFECARWNEERQQFDTDLGLTLSAGNIVQFMLNKEEED